MTQAVQKQQPMYYSIIGLILLLSWLMVGGFNSQLNLSTYSGFKIADSILKIFYSYFINWKLFTLICFLIGIRVFIHVEIKTSQKSFLIQSTLIILVSLVFAWVSSLFLIVIPIIVFSAIVMFLQQKHTNAIYFLMGFLIVAVLIASIYNNKSLFFYPCFNNLFALQFRLTTISEIKQIFFSPNGLLQLIYGFAIIIVGFWVGKSSWLLEYHFYYNELKKLFKYSLSLFVLWILLNFFEIYLFISKWKIGEIFYILDGLCINIILVFIYLFALIYFENFRWGKIFLKLLESVGKMWLINLIILVSVIFLLKILNLKLSLMISSILSLLVFIILSILSRFFSKRYYNGFWLKILTLFDAI